MGATSQTVEAIFDSALELTDAGERAALLDRACAGNPQLRARVEKLLAAHARSERFFSDCAPALAVAGGADEPAAAPPRNEAVEDPVGSRIGPYKLLQKIGEGGCGVVYMAEQERPVRRRVALKVIKLGMDTRQVIARFEAERQALALMDHPNIARVLDAGATETGRPYFVMELVHGIRITEYCDKSGLSTRQRLELFTQVCHAIQHAHQKSIIHRDIKPSNVLVTLHDGVAVPKVIDFGIAKAMEEKLTDKTLFTMFGHFVGTPAYMSPEQAQMSGLDVDTRSDIYSLGVLLYELLTGKTPFDQNELMASGLDEMRRTLREREPHRPSTKLDTLRDTELTMTAQRRHAAPPGLRSELQGDLDWVVMKALEKDRTRRYETANGFAMDIVRFLNHEPVVARPPSRRYRFSKLVQRNRALFTAIGAVSAALVLGLSLSTFLFFREREARQRAVAAEQEQARLRRAAEAREKIATATAFIRGDQFAEADELMKAVHLEHPTVEGAAVLRKLGAWHALKGRWQPASERLGAALQVNQLNDKDVISSDFLATAAVLAAAGETNQFQSFRHHLAHRFAGEKSPYVLERIVKAALLLPADNREIQALHPLTREIVPTLPMSIGNLRSSTTDEGAEAFLKKLKLLDVGTKQPYSMASAEGVTTLVAGGANIWEKRDEFIYAFTSLAGDFDFRMQVCSIMPKPDPYSRIGLMAREVPDQSSSRHVMVAVNATNTFQVVMRSQVGAAATSVPQDPLPAAYASNSWVRLQRVGAIFHAYTSSNGVDWVQLYQTTGGDKPFSDPICFGIAASSHSTVTVASNVVSNFGATPNVSVDTALALALLDHRRGDATRSAEWCRRLLAYPECDMIHGSAAHALLAMACAKLNQPEDARQHLALARDSIERRLSGGLVAGNNAEGFWFDWVFVRELLREADGALR
jgi:serine/threonine protein kinase